MAAVLTCDSFVMCICNVYLPCFEQSEEYSTILMECLSYIDYVHDLLLREHIIILNCVLLVIVILICTNYIIVNMLHVWDR